jgi:hypothetical protein
MEESNSDASAKKLRRNTIADAILAFETLGTF